MNTRNKEILPVASSTPSDAQQKQIERKYGMFIHFGMNTFLNVEWSDGKSDPSVYQPTAIDAENWVRTAKDAGMKYVILVTKHHEGFCLWNSKFTNYDVGASGNTTNVIEEVAKACQKYGIELGLYYSLWDRNFNDDNEDPASDEAYSKYMLNQLNELIDITEKYTPIIEFWFDGGWAKSNDRWPLKDIYQIIKSREPNCQIGINWSIGLPNNIDYKVEYHSVLPHEYKEGYPIRYFPSDFRLGDPYLPVKNDPKLYSHNGQLYYMPFETTVCISEKWFYHTDDHTFKTIDELFELYKIATAEDNILILNCPPNRDGVIRQEEVEILKELKNRISILEQKNNSLNIPLLEGEQIWSGAIKEGHLMPFKEDYSFDFYANNNYNQLQPLLLSNKGLYVWSEGPYRFQIKNDKIIVTDNSSQILYGRSGSSLPEARNYASAAFFPASGKMPDIDLFAKPQYNTWIELTYYHTQEKVLEYARGIIANGFPPGVLMIDESWQENYGIWKFHSGRFPDPKGMMDELHSMGFKVMLWVVPFVCPDRYLVVDELLKKKALLMDSEQSNYDYETAVKPAIIQWWNGYSACLDFTSKAAIGWFDEQLQFLMKEYGIDGFKFDGGDMNFYPEYALSQAKATPNDHCFLYAELGLKYSLNEFRACWKLAGKPLAQRLHDKFHSWNDLQLLIPHMTTESLVGYTFSCPDMIGGGEWTSFQPGKDFDQDLVVRSAQCHALMPMMQFSVAPWRVLDEQHLKAIKTAVEIRDKYTERIIQLAELSAQNGEPIIGSMEYYYPNEGFKNVKDQFLLGPTILVAPVVDKSFSRKIILPEGEWIADDGKVYSGAKIFEIHVPLERLPVFKLQIND
ncbi:MAG: alpha-L-fucosidase [Prolixibacteraceae bacterium]